MEHRQRDTGLTFAGLVAHNVSVKKLRLVLTSLAIAIGVLTVVTFNVVDHSLRASALAIMQTGRADFTIAQKGTSDLLNSNIDAATYSRIRSMPGVAEATGVLVGTTRINAANPLFLEIGIRPGDMTAFGVTVDAGIPFAPRASHEVMLGWRAANNLGKRVGDSLTIDGHRLRVVGIFSTGQDFQGMQRQPSELTLAQGPHHPVRP